MSQLFCTCVYPNTQSWPNTQRPNTHPNPQSNLNDNMASATNSTVYNRMGEQRRADDVEDATFYSEYVNSRMRPPQQHIAWGAGTSGASGATRSLSEGSGVMQLNDQDFPPLNKPGDKSMGDRPYRRTEPQRLNDEHATYVKYAAGNVVNSQTSNSNGAKNNDRRGGGLSEQQNVQGGADRSSTATGAANLRHNQTMSTERDKPRATANK